MIDKTFGIADTVTVTRCKPIITTTAVSYPVTIWFQQDISDEGLLKLWRFCNENLIYDIADASGQTKSKSGT